MHYCKTVATHTRIKIIVITIMHYCNHNVHTCRAVFIWAKTENKVCLKRNKKSIILLILGESTILLSLIHFLPSTLLIYIYIYIYVYKCINVSIQYGVWAG